MTRISLDETLRRAVASHQAGRLAEAESLYRQVLAADAAQPDALHLMGVLAHQARRPETAIELVRQALVLRPDWPEALNTLASALKESGQLAEAIRTFEHALTLRPEQPEILLNIGAAWKEMGELQKAEECYRRALACRPDYADAYSNLGNTLGAQGRLDEATECYRQAIRIQPDYASARMNLAAALLLAGDFQGGWDEYEWRWKIKGSPSAARRFSQPLWNGEELAEKTIFVHAEQGFGDTIQFARYIPLLAERPAKQIIVECQPELLPLLQSIPNISLVAAGRSPPPFDLHFPLLSLPRAFKTTLETIPDTVPYLSAPKERLIHFKTLLAQALPAPPSVKTLPRIGLSWHGKSRPHPYRSIPIRLLAPLAQFKNVTFISLQTDPAAANLAAAAFPILDFSAHLHDFADTAALVSNLDLIISIDTATTHLAGALGKPTWTLLPFVADWRWLRFRSDSPWYPSMRLFRQIVPQDWESAVNAVVAALKEYFASH